MGPLARGRTLRKQLTEFLERTRKTPRGEISAYVDPRDREVILGTPSGPHTPIKTPWIYKEKNSSRCMIFGFYEGRNGRGNDIIGKALPHVDHFEPKVGASLQLNAALNLADDGDHVEISHHGKVVRGKSIGRVQLAELIREHAPDQARALGPRFPPDTWPFSIGSTRNIPRLLDRLYLYTWCLQAAKDAFDRPQVTPRRSSLDLAPLNVPPEVPESASYTPGFAGKRRAFSPPPVIESESLHNYVVTALYEALNAELPKTLEIGNTTYIDLYVQRRDLTQAKVAVFEIKTDCSLQSIYTAIGQLYFHGSDALLRIMVLPLVAADIRERVAGFGIRTLAYEWRRPTKPAFEDLDTLIKEIRRARP